MPGQYSNHCCSRPHPAAPRTIARLFLCARCRAQVLICSHCDRGQIYCARGCAQTARREAQRAAGRRYQASRRGRVNHALRAGRYRTRQKNVTHQGSPPGLSDDLVTPGWAKRASEPPSVCRVSGVQTRSRCDRDPTWRCQWCGRRCSPFVRYEFLRGRTCSIRRQTSARRRP